jgi:hypothetical protein
MRQVEIDPAAVEAGTMIWLQLMPDGSSGQGGIVLGHEDGVWHLECGTAKYYRQIPDSEVHHVVVEEYLDADECLEYHKGDCSGPVDYHITGSSLKAWPRCQHHAEQRWERYDQSMERYADSDVVPEWFDPADAGERWEDDY